MVYNCCKRELVSSQTINTERENREEKIKDTFAIRNILLYFPAIVMRAENFPAIQ